MTFGDLLGKVKAVEIKEMRFDLPEYVEFVIGVTSEGCLHPILESYFGPPLKRAGKVSPGEVAHIMEPFGGIRLNQTLYYFQNQNLITYAMLWPWADGTSITVKISQFQQE